jgi:sugar phosphate isomerase/epimerase
MWKGLALHTWTLDTTPLADVLRIARTTGWDAVELRRLDFKRALETGRTADQVLDLVRTTGLFVACVGVQAGWMFAEGEERNRLLQAFAESCRWAAALRCDTVMSPVDPGRGKPSPASARSETSPRPTASAWRWSSTRWRNSSTPWSGCATP